jgi:two-component system, OmpR family, sensor histidine kinase KdpD
MRGSPLPIYTGSVEPNRPDPDELLKKIADEDARKQRAKLKIFFGMAPGVGKTYTMLKVARELKAEGLEVLVGVVETHGRVETAALAEGFETIPKKTLPYRGIFMEEFDLAAALKRKPQLILMDELAHTNVQGSLHQKRWQDVWDLLDAGIDVYTTVNVQHIESLRDVVAQITGVIVRENIPDTILKRADEIEIVDIPPDELIQRLKEGKVYVPEQARHAIDRFFRKGNLLALRELALRRVAEHVDADMRRYMSTKGIGKTWAAGERLLVCISPRLESSRLIRATKRMAESLNASWIAVYVENARGLRHSEEDRARLEEHLRLAERLGGETIVTQGGVHIAQDLINLAISRNVSKILIGKPRKPRWVEFFTGSLLAELVRRSGDIDVHVITGEGEPGEKKPVSLHAPKPRLATVGHVMWAALAVLAATGANIFIHRHFELSEIVMVYLLAILAVALRFGRSASLAASIMSVIALDLVFIPPAFSLAIDDFKHLGTFSVMLIVGYIIGNLVERVHAQTRLARSREQRILALFRLTGELTRSAGSAAMVESAILSVANQFQSKVTVMLPDAKGRLQGREGKGGEGFSQEELGVAQWAFDHREAAGMGTDTLPGAQALYQPLIGAKGILGVMGIRPEGVAHGMEPDQRHLLEAFANQTALALERAILAEKNLESQRQMDREQMRNALLSSVSHDLRTPLGSITGAATTLLEEKGELTPETRRELLETIHEDAYQLHRLVSNLLDVTRLESGVLEVNRAWIPAEELVGSALERLGAVLGDRPLKVELPSNLPLMSVDAVLMEQVIINLLENAHKYSPKDMPIEIKGWATDRAVTLAIADHGPGIPEGEEERIFEKLVRLPQGATRPGAGLGLAICKGIVEAHGGWIQAGNRPSGGAQILLSLPLEGQPPKLPVEESAHA